MKNPLRSAFVGAVALFTVATQDLEGAVYRLEATGTITSENDSANIVNNSVLGVGSGFSYSFLFDTGAAAQGGIPGVIQGFNGNTWNFAFGNIVGTANNGSLLIANDQPDYADFSFNAIQSGTTITASGLPGTAYVNSFQSLYSASGDIWSGTSLNSLINGDLALTDSRFQTFRINDSFNNVAIFDGNIQNYTVTEITAVPEPGSTALIFALGAGIIAGVDIYRRRKEKQASAPATSTPGGPAQG